MLNVLFQSHFNCFQMTPNPTHSTPSLEPRSRGQVLIPLKCVSHIGHTPPPHLHRYSIRLMKVITRKEKDAETVIPTSQSHSRGLCCCRFYSLYPCLCSNQPLVFPSLESITIEAKGSDGQSVCVFLKKPTCSAV